MKNNKNGFALVETLVCMLLAAAVILAGLDFSALAIKVVVRCEEQREKSIALSSIINEIGAGWASADVATRPGWAVSTRYDTKTGTTSVLISGAIRNASLDVSWREWPIGRGER
ncbi:MAG: hypothetical protein LBT31_06885 [Synergistaceae bacterium]|jgi:Tfp pilus assembly protein PilV|nr:hypothetical protein [Synergistaceae bacterium]